MVSTRGAKFKFTEGEKVLCYEPDPSKTKVLYDSKVLEVVQKGRKGVEYLIHFQGWNSSWDRCVPEEFVLRDTEENRELQKHLAEKSQLHLKDRGRQRGSKTYSDYSKQSEGSESDMDDALDFDLLADDDQLLDDDDLDDENDDQDVEDEEEEDNKENEHENEQQVGGETERQLVPLEFPKEFKHYLDLDWDRVNNKKMRLRLPANPCINLILETYIKEYARELLSGADDSKGDSDQDSMRSKTHPQRASRPRKRQRRASSNSSCDNEEADKEYQEVLRNLGLAKEIAHSLRFYVDFTLGDQLLYAAEKSQYNHVCNMVKEDRVNELKYRHNPPPFPMTHRLLSKGDSDSEDQGKSDTEAELLEMISAVDESFPQRWNDLLRDAGCEIDPPESYVMKGDDEDDIMSHSKSKNSSTLQPAFSPSCSDRGSGSRSARGGGDVLPTTSSPRDRESKKKAILDKILAWKIVPEEFACKHDTEIAQIYGAVHLSRLLVKLPEFLAATKLPESHVKVIQRHLNLIIMYLSKQPSWFLEQNYYTETWETPDSDHDY